MKPPVPNNRPAHTSRSEAGPAPPKPGSVTAMLRTFSSYSSQTPMTRSGSKDSLASVTSTNSQIVGSTLVKFGKFSKQGQLHANEDSVCILDSLLDAEDDSAEVDMSEILSFLEDRSTSQETFLESVMMATICDGHGGAACSAFVSRQLAARTLGCFKAMQLRALDRSPAVFYEAFRQTERDFISDVAAAKADNSGSCALAALVNGRELVVAHVGDCRAVLCNNGVVSDLTKDHRCTDPKEMMRIVQAGGLIRNGRLNGVLAPSRAFGDLDVKSVNPDGVLKVDPDVCMVTVTIAQGVPATFVILASDGVWDVLSSASACDFVGKVLTRSSNNAEVAATKLVEACAKHTKDDVSAVVIVWGNASPQSDALMSPVSSPVVSERKKFHSSAKLKL